MTIDDPRDHLQAIWRVLHAYQDEMIPYEKYQELADDAEAVEMNHTAEGYQATADLYREEWDEICFAMARITELLGLDPKEV